MTLLHALLCDESADYSCHGDDPYYRNDHYVENEIELSAVQFGTGLGYFLSPGLALGGRAMLQSGGARPEEVPIAGVGPELTYFTESHGKWTPFVAASALYTRELTSCTVSVVQPGVTPPISPLQQVRGGSPSCTLQMISWAGGSAAK